jgi:SAM-dependent methyltransferase
MSMSDTIPVQASQAHCRAYAAVAPEYYDELRHPTCAALRRGSVLVLSQLIEEVAPKHWAAALEVGTGRTILPEVGVVAEETLLSDINAEMLVHSRPLGLESARFLVASADHLPVESGSIDLMVASLADPYNTSYFWHEAARVLRPGGHLAWSAPSHEWASTFRSSCPGGQEAVFETLNGEVHVPSYVLPISDQERLIRDSGLQCVTWIRAALGEVSGARAVPKLAGVLSDFDPIVAAVLVVKP